MIDAIVGQKGTGKTALLVQEISEFAKKPDTNIVCIEYGRRFDQSLPYTVRLIDITEYPVNGYGELVAFIAGINAKDYDISHLYIDSIYKVAQDDKHEDLAVFVDKLQKFSDDFKLDITLTISDDAKALPANVQAIIRK